MEKQAKTTVLIALKAILRSLGFLLCIWKAIKVFSFFSGLIRPYSQYCEFLSSTSLRMESESVSRSVVSDSL